MNILGIETSCDETAAAVVKDGKEILSNVVATSEELHKTTGGIIPESAAREQVRSIIPVIKEALSDVGKENIDAIAVTYGPGLIGSLLVGVETAKTLSYLWNKPLIAANHLVAHIYAGFVSESPPEFPLVALVVSGGHTDLVHMNGHAEINLLGATRDDAAGETFDKTARLLGLPYPGGPEIAKLADRYLTGHPDKKLNLFPRPMINSKDFDWSFSGLKTAVLNYTKGHEYQNYIPLLATEIQEAIVDVLVEKSIQAIKKHNPKSFILGGGVANNKRLQERFRERIKEEKLSAKFFVGKYNTDNAVMIAAAAYYNNKPIDWRKLSADPELAIDSPI